MIAPAILALQTAARAEARGHHALALAQVRLAEAMVAVTRERLEAACGDPDPGLCVALVESIRATRHARRPPALVLVRGGLDPLSHERAAETDAERVDVVPESWRPEGA